MLKITENILFPKLCYICGKDNLNKFAVCCRCAKNLDFSREHSSGSILPENGSSIFFDKIFSVFHYDKRIQKLLFQYKSLGKKHVSDYFIHEITNHINFSTVDIDYISYVPMRWRKKISRGFNQAELLACKLSKKMKKKTICFLVKNKTKNAQKDLNFTQRHINAIGSYAILQKNASFLKNSSILLVDDVFTTGATLNECARILKKNGAKNVFSLTVGITHDKK